MAARALETPPSQNSLSRAATAPGVDGASDTGDGEERGLQLNRKMRVALGEEEPFAKEEVVHESLAFTAQGPEEGRLCEKTRTLCKRFAAPQKHEDPDGFRYKPLYTVVSARIPQCDFGQRPKHASRKAPSTDINTTDPFVHIDLGSPSHSFSAAMLAKRKPRPAAEDEDGAKVIDRFGKSTISMREPATGAKDWRLHDLPSSRRPRVPSANFAIGGRSFSGPIGPLSEPGGYDVNSAAVHGKVKSGFSMSKARSAAELRLTGHGMPKDILVEEGVSGKGVQVDRSFHRGGPLTRPRLTHLHDFGKELPRPPLNGKEPVYYDAEDPEVSAAWLQWRMTFDPSTADRAVVRRQQVPKFDPDVVRGIVRGYRPLEDDVGMLMAQGKGPSGSPEVAPGVEMVKEKFVGERPDICVRAFPKYSSREHTREGVEYSPLHRPRSLAAPDFARHTMDGFRTRTTVATRQRPATATAQVRWSSEISEDPGATAKLMKLSPKRGGDLDRSVGARRDRAPNLGPGLARSMVMGYRPLEDQPQMIRAQGRNNYDATPEAKRTFSFPPDRSSARSTLLEEPPSPVFDVGGLLPVTAS